MSTSLKSVNTADLDLESIGTNNLGSPDAVNPHKPNPEDTEKNIQRLLEEISWSAKSERPEVALAALVDVQSTIQQIISSLTERIDRGSHKNGGTEGLEASDQSDHEFTEALRAMLQDLKVPSHTFDDVTSQGDNKDTSEPDGEESDSTNEHSPKDPIYDKADGVYRCADINCGWEVAFGYCHGCQTKYATEDDENEAVDPTNSLTVLTRGSLIPGGDSPSPEPISSSLRPSRFKRNPQMFEELISRGATLAFCETWSVTFEEDCGIVVQANDRLKEIYGSFLREGDSWSICIGRRIKLFADDSEGDLFMEDLLDLIFTEDDDKFWITYKEYEFQTHWITRPKGGLTIEGMGQVAEVGDEYETWSGEDDDGESSVGSYAGETSQSEAESTSDPATSDCESTWWSDDSENEPEGDAQDDLQDAGQVADFEGGNENEPAV